MGQRNISVTRVLFCVEEAMLALFKTIRVIFLVIAIWQILTILPAFTWFFQLASIQEYPAQLGAVSVQVILKLCVATISFGIYYGLRPLQRRHEPRKKKSIASGVVPEAGSSIPTRMLSWKKCIALVLTLIAVGITLGIISLKSPAYSPMVASKCTSGFDAMQSHYPNLQGYSVYEVAQILTQNEPPEKAKSSRDALVKQLLDCRWTKTTNTLGGAIYLDKGSIMLLPNGRRVATFLSDYYAPIKLGETTDEKVYKSLKNVVLVSCQDMGTLVTFVSYLSQEFGWGEEVARRGGGLELERYTIAPLWPSEEGSVARHMAQAACEIK